MQRTYLALAGLGLTALGAQALNLPLAEARGVFTTQPLDPARIAVLGRPTGASLWSLLVVEQLTAETPCWQTRSDGLVETAAGRTAPAGTCASYLDSNGYSLRVAEDDLGSSYRLRLQQVGQELQLQAMNPRDLTPLVVGRAALPSRARDGFVPIRLEPEWQLSRRMFGEQPLSHVYFANATPIAQLIAQARGSSEARTLATSAPAALENFRLGSPSTGSTEAGPIALQVIPFRD